MSGTVFEIQPGAAAPAGCTVFYHNGKQYAFTDGTWTGSTFIPTVPITTMPPPVDLSPLYGLIQSLADKVESIAKAYNELRAEMKGLRELMLKRQQEENSEVDSYKERSDAWREEVVRRFDDVDRALRLALDE